MGKNVSEVHVPVLEDEVMEHLQLRNGGVYVDATLGLGGHSERILENTSPDGRVVGFEWDRQAVELAAERLGEYGDRLMIIHSSYAGLLEGLVQAGVGMIDGLLLDLGVSSLQLDKGDRGFSFKADAPLDMRMDKRQKVTAADLVGKLSKEEMADIFYNFGEERQSRRIAEHIVQARGKKTIETTVQLADIVSRAIPRKYHPKKKHVATKVFQALRIAVNREFENIVKILADAPVVMASGARICVITFHSLEDRIVKQAFVGNEAYKIVTKRPVKPSEKEIFANPRARSAKLRVAARV